MGNGPLAMRVRRPGPERSLPYEARSSATRTISRHAGAPSTVGARHVDLGQHLLGRTGALLAPERRDGGEAADAIAALGDLDVGPRGTAGGAGQPEVEPVGGGCRPGARRPAVSVTGTAAAAGYAAPTVT